MNGRTFEMGGRRGGRTLILAGQVEAHLHLGKRFGIYSPDPGQLIQQLQRHLPNVIFSVTPSGIVEPHWRKRRRRDRVTQHPTEDT